jgi:hypothetical protein
MLNSSWMTVMSKSNLKNILAMMIRRVLVMKSMKMYFKIAMLKMYWTTFNILLTFFMSIQVVIITKSLLLQILMKTNFLLKKLLL